VIGKSLSEIDTPQMLLDKGRLQNNIQHISQLANAQNLKVRPHIKTHKCIEIFQLQQDAGAVGITASKTEEALTFIENGVKSVTVAYPLVVESKLDRLIAAARDVDLRLIVDSFAGVEVISRVATRHGKTVDIFLKIDVGLHRCGITEDNPRLVELAQAIDSASGLNLIGLLSHAGHVYGAPTADDVRNTAQEECQILNRVRGQLEDNGLQLSEVSVGSTPTVLASDTYDGITEIRPGNYVFMDRTPLRFSLIALDQIAFTVLATVVSANSDYFIIDTGSKTLSTDQGAHGIAGMEGFGLAYPLDRFEEQSSEMIIAKLSEEHGFVVRGDFDLPIGAKLRVVPNHSCVVANLADTYAVVAGDKVVDGWQVAARGQVR
jgi:D-serine deaminase-like pyridoxal phosphate-dependent protein